MEINTQQQWESQLGQIAGVLDNVDTSMIGDQFQIYILYNNNSMSPQSTIELQQQQQQQQFDLFQPIQYIDTNTSIPSLSTSSVSSISFVSTPSNPTFSTSTPLSSTTVTTPSSFSGFSSELNESDLKLEPVNSSIELECHESMCSSSVDDPTEDDGFLDVHGSFPSFKVETEEEEEDLSLSSIRSNPIENQRRKNQYPCRMCNKTYVYLRNLRKHEEQHHLPHPSSSSNGSYQIRPVREIRCKLCRTNYPESEFPTHVTSAHQNLWTCSVCFRSFGSLRGLKLHAFFHSEPREKKYECNICLRKYTHSRSLTFHKKIHAQESQMQAARLQQQQQQSSISYNLPSFSFMSMDQRMNENP